MKETWIQILGQEDPLEKGMATHSSILAWRILWIEEPGRLQSMGSQKSWTRLSDFHFTCSFENQFYPPPDELDSWDVPRSASVASESEAGGNPCILPCHQSVWAVPLRPAIGTFCLGRIPVICEQAVMLYPLLTGSEGPVVIVSPWWIGWGWVSSLNCSCCIISAKGSIVSIEQTCCCSIASLLSPYVSRNWTTPAPLKEAPLTSNQKLKKSLWSSLRSTWIQMPASRKVKGGQESGWHVALAWLADIVYARVSGWLGRGGLCGYLQDLCSPPHQFQGGWYHFPHLILSCNKFLFSNFCLSIFLDISPKTSTVSASWLPSSPPSHCFFIGYLPITRGPCTGCLAA